MNEKEFLLVSELSQKDGCLTQRNIAQRIGLSLGQTNAILKRLSEQGYIQILYKSPRRIEYLITPQGQEECQKKAHKHLERALAFLPGTSLSTEPKITNYFDLLRERIETRQARIGILGLGYVGLPLACAFAKRGFPTTGFEVDSDKVARIERGESYISDVPSDLLQELSAQEQLKTSVDFSLLGEQDVLIICVPTPLRKTKDPDISYILSAAQSIQKCIRPGQLIILESTTYPGTTREILLGNLARPDFQVGKDFFLAFSPERVDPGNKEFQIHNTPKVVGGMTTQCLRLAKLLYEKVIEKIHTVSSVEVAEMTKLLENTFRAVNIGLVNELAMMCDKLGINVWEVIEAAKTKPFGFTPFYPGPGIGGHCIPLDPQYLAWKAKSLNFEPRFIELAEAINSKMPEFVVEKVADILNTKVDKPLSRSTLFIIGVAYKKDTADTRESPALSIIEILQRKKARVLYHDPYVPLIQIDREILHSIPLETSILRGADIVLILTNHSTIDYPSILRNARWILDTRCVFATQESPTLVYL